MADTHINPLVDPKSLSIDPRSLSIDPKTDLLSEEKNSFPINMDNDDKVVDGDGDEVDGGADPVARYLIPVQQPSLLSTFNIVVVLIIFLIIVMLYYVMQLQKSQSCQAIKPKKKVTPVVEEPEMDPINQDQSMEGFSATRPLSSTFYGSYGGVPVKSSNSAPMNSPNSYDGQTVIANSYKNKERADHLLKMDMGPRSLTDNMKSVEFEHARQMG